MLSQCIQSYRTQLIVAWRKSKVWPRRRSSFPSWRYKSGHSSSRFCSKSCRRRLQNAKYNICLGNVVCVLERWYRPDTRGFVLRSLSPQVLILIFAPFHWHCILKFVTNIFGNLRQICFCQCETNTFFILRSVSRTVWVLNLICAPFHWHCTYFQISASEV